MMTGRFNLAGRAALAGAALCLVAGAPRAELFSVDLYEILESHPKCSGPGKIAYKATLDLLLDDAEYFRTIGDLTGKEQRECSITVAKGLKREVYAVECPPSEGAVATTDPETAINGFCGITKQLRPSELHMTAELTGCISIDGHVLVDGSWEVTSKRPAGNATFRGEYNDPRLVVDYSPGGDVLGSKFGPFLTINVAMDDLKLDSDPQTEIGVVGHVISILADKSKPGCAEDAESCLQAALAASKPTDQHTEVDAKVCFSTEGGAENAAGLTVKKLVAGDE